MCETSNVPEKIEAYVHLPPTIAYPCTTDAYGTKIDPIAGLATPVLLTKFDQVLVNMTCVDLKGLFLCAYVTLRNFQSNIQLPLQISRAEQMHKTVRLYVSQFDSHFDRAPSQSIQPIPQINQPKRQTKDKP